MENPKVSLFASAVRTSMWKEYLDSLKSTSIPYQVIFSGCNTKEEVSPFLLEYPELSYIFTAPIKPSQNYALASRACIGETISWSCDDADYSGDVLGKAYRYWKSKDNEKLILSIQTKETGYKNYNGTLFNMNEHRFFSWVPDSPLMCPMNLMSRKFFNDLGGYDMRYLAGQAENDLCCRAYQYGGISEIFGDENCYIMIDHMRKSIESGESIDDESFLHRPFATGYKKDREILENSWTTFDEVDVFKRLQNGERPLTLRKISPIQLDEFQPYPDNIPLDHSLSNKGKWI